MLANRRRKLIDEIRRDIIELSLLPKVSAGDITSRIRSLYPI
jgi:hypothetical protein